MDKNYYYLVNVNPSDALSYRGVSRTNRYAREFAELFGEHAGRSLERFAMTKEQLALFFYLRCRMGGHNGVRDLDMTRATSAPAEHVIDLRAGSCACVDEAPEPTVVALAKELEQVDSLLARVAGGETLTINGLALNGDHMTQVLKAQRGHVRAKLFAKINIPTV
jgi:hypothetical protein